MHCNGPKISYRQVWANSVDPDQSAPRSSLIRVYTVCNLLYKSQSMHHSNKTFMSKSSILICDSADFLRSLFIYITVHSVIHRAGLVGRLLIGWVALSLKKQNVFCCCCHCFLQSCIMKSHNVSWSSFFSFSFQKMIFFQRKSQCWNIVKDKLVKVLSFVF